VKASGLLVVWRIRLLLLFALRFAGFLFPLATQPQQQRRNHTHDTPPTPQQPT
jgi:hypothetical protein